MASEDKKPKTSLVPKTETAAKKEAPAEKTVDGPPKDKSTSATEPSKKEGGEKAADAPSGYSRGEGQKAVTNAYRDNWNAIYGKKKR
jgi:hypothetical protein